MIINDSARFAFIHIPKCAGTTVRDILRPLDDLKGAHTDRRGPHPELGYIDYVHIPLFTLREHFSSTFRKVENYWAFAIVRDPFSRFPSSLSQHLKMYGEAPIHRMRLREVEAAVARAMDFLEAAPRKNYLLPAQYIHFQKQVDFIYLDGNQVVDTVVSMERLDWLLEEVGRRIGRELSPAEAELPAQNRVMIHRNAGIRLVAGLVRPVTRSVGRLLPDSLWERLNGAIFVPRDERLRRVFEAEHVRAFIKDYYRDDIELFSRIATRLNPEHEPDKNFRRDGAPRR